MRLAIFWLFFVVCAASLRAASPAQYLLQCHCADAEQAHQLLSDAQAAPAALRMLSRAWGIYAVDYPAALSQSQIEQIRKQPKTLHWQENRPVQQRSRAPQYPNDPYYAQNRLWHHTLMQTPDAWGYTTGGNTALGDSIAVAVIDGGCDLQHADLVDNLWRNRHETPNNGIDDDENGYIDDYRGYAPPFNSDSLTTDAHGTSVAGIIGAAGNNGIGTVGINWRVSIIPVQLTALTGGGIRESDVIAAYDYVASLRRRYNETNGTSGAFIVAANSSFGIDDAWAADYPIWCGLYDSLGGLGILSVAATTNRLRNTDNTGDMPSSCSSPYLLTVTETDQRDELNAGYGLQLIDIAAPANLPSTRPNDQYGTFGGTSASAPQVSGAVALLAAYPDTAWAQRLRTAPSTTAIDIKRLLLQNVDRTDELIERIGSGGRLNIGKSIRALAEQYEAPDENALLAAFPNPTKDLVFIKIANADADYSGNLQLYDAAGRLLQSIAFEPSRAQTATISLDLSRLAAGVYFLSWQEKSTGLREWLKIAKQ